MNLGIEGLAEAKQIGVGGSATVYRARQEKLGRDVAVKVLNSTDPDLVRRFEREAKSLGLLGSKPGIVAVYDSGVTSHGSPYLLIELCPTSLQQQLSDHGRYDPVSACYLVADVAGAVADAHDMGVVHRDIKPGNILLNSEGRPLVTDFGISTVLSATFGHTNSVGFSPGYAAPETLKGEEPSSSADVYGLGVTLFQLITGQPPFSDSEGGSSNLLALANRVATEPIPNLRDRGVSDAICRAIESATTKDPTIRPTARQFQHQLSAIANNASQSRRPAQAQHGIPRQPSLDRQTPPSPKAVNPMVEQTSAKPSRPHGWLVGAGVAVVLLVVAGLALFLQSRGLDGGETVAGSSTTIEPTAVAAPTTEAGTTTVTLATTSEVIQNPGDGTTINTSYSQWSGDDFQTEVVFALLRELGYEIDSTVGRLATVDALTSMSEDTLDIWTQTWYPGHTGILGDLYGSPEEADKNLVPVGDLMENGYVEGFVVTKSVAEDNNVVSLDQINDTPELVGLFDLDGNGKAEIQGCDEEWACHGYLSKMLEVNEWQNLEVISVDYYAQFQESEQLVKAESPVVQYIWHPSAWTATLVPGQNVLWLSVGDVTNVLTESQSGDINFRNYGAAPLGDKCTSEPCRLGMAWSDVRISARAEFLDDNPAAAKLLDSIVIDPQDVANVERSLFDIRADQRDYVGEAAEWIDLHRPDVEQWLTSARSAGK